jgi:hypothetical protein
MPSNTLYLKLRGFTESGWSENIWNTIFYTDESQERTAGLSLNSVETWLVQYQTLVEHWMWLMVLATLVLDVHTTTVGLEQGFAESNPLLRAAFEMFGVSILWQLKAVAAVIGLGCWTVLPRDERVLVPASLGLPWALAALSNTGLLVFT